MPAATSSCSDWAMPDQQIDRGAQLNDPVFSIRRWLSEADNAMMAHTVSRGQRNHAGELGADLQSAEQVHGDLW